MPTESFFVKLFFCSSVKYSMCYVLSFNRGAWHYVMFLFVSVGSRSHQWWDWKIFNVSYASKSLGCCILSFIHGKMSW